MKILNLTLSRRAFDNIKKECLKYPDVETGGILVGKCNALDFVAPYAIGSGPSALRSPTRFEPDVFWQQKFLNGYNEKYGLNYIGSFHRHFGNFFCPSPIDHSAAMYITSDPDWGVSQIIFPIILLKEEMIEIYPYSFSRENPNFQLIPMLVVPDEHPLIYSYPDDGEEKC